MFHHNDIREDVREHVRVLGNVVQDGANLARGRIGEILNTPWPNVINRPSSSSSEPNRREPQSDPEGRNIHYNFFINCPFQKRKPLLQ